MKQIYLLVLALTAILLPDFANAQDENDSEPFSWGDFSWVQGNNRQKEPLLKGKYFTGSFTLDANYNYSFNRPIDHTNSGSTATFRSNEFNISYI